MNSQFKNSDSLTDAMIAEEFDFMAESLPPTPKWFWIITKDRIFDPYFDDKPATGTRSGNPALRGHGPRSSFSLYDDDQQCYFEGHIYGTGWSGFEPLDDFGRGWGCTMIKIDGEWL